MTAKVPIRAVFDGSTATGLAEYQSGEYIDLTYGGLGVSLSLGTANQVLRVNSSANAVEFGSIVGTGALDSGSITSGFGAIDNGTSNIRSATITAETAFVPDAADGASLGTSSLEFSDLFLADGGTITLGNGQDITITHVADTGIEIKNVSTSGNSGVGAVLSLQTGDTDIAVNNVLGQIDFQAPDEGTASDAVLVAASIAAVSEGDFSASNNATKLSFKTGASEVATEKMSLSSGGNLTVSGTIAGTLATAAQTNITSLGTLTALQIDNININGNAISSTAGTDLTITPVSGQQIVLDGTIVVDAGVVTGATSITSTAFVGTLSTAAQANVTSLGTLTALTVDNVVINGAIIGHTDDTDLITLADGVVTVAGELDAATLDISGNVDIAGTTNLDVVDIDGAVNISAATTMLGTLTVGADDTGHDVKMFGATSGSFLLFDESADKLLTAGALTVDIVKDKLLIGGTAVTTTAAELNLLDNVSGLVQADFTKLAAVDATAAELNIVDGGTSATSTTVADADRVVLNDGGTMVQVAVTDLAAYFDDEITAMPNLVSVGALNTGSITSGFTSIDIGTGAITTTGLISGGSLDIDNVLINGVTIGHTDDTDLITLADGLVTVAGEISVTTLDIGGTNVAATAAELNIMDGGTSASSTTVADADRLVLNDGGTMKQVAVTDLAAYFDDEITAMGNLVETGALDAGSISAGFGAIDNGTSGIRTATFVAETAYNPDANDGATLGTTSLGFADAFLADGSTIQFGNDQDVTLTHVADTGLLLNSTMAIQFNDASQFINAPSNAILDINATDEIELNATLLDVNANINASGTYTGAGVMTTGGNIVIPDGATIGSASDTDAITIASDGVTTFSANVVIPNLTVSGTQTIANTVTMNAENAIVFEGATADAHETTLTIVDPTADHTYHLPDLGSTADEGFLAAFAASPGTSGLITSTPAELNKLDGVTASTAQINNATLTTATTTELNIMDGGTSATSTTLADADRIVVNDAGTMKQVALTDVSTYVLSNVTAVGALNSGSITSGFGTIDTGSSAITTTGTINFGNLADGNITVTGFIDEDDMSSDSAGLLPTQQSVKAYVDTIAGQSNNVVGLTASAAELNILDDATVTTAELNILDGSATTQATVTLTGTDGVVISDADVMKQALVSDFDTYVSGTTKTLNNKTLASGSITSGFGTIDTGASAITTTGVGSFGSLDISGAIDVDGVTNLDVTDIQGNLTVGVNDTGYDVKFFGATSGQFLKWTQAQDELVLAGDSKLSFHDAAGGENIIASANGHLEINSGTTIDATAPTIQVNASTLFDVNGDADISGSLLQTGVATFTEKPIANKGISVKNGATGPGFIEFFEDSDSSGGNKVTLIGPASTADVTLTLPAAAGTIATTINVNDEAVALAIALG